MPTVLSNIVVDGRPYGATIHMATGGYDTSTPRLMHRAQVLGDEALYRRKNAA